MNDQHDGGAAYRAVVDNLVDTCAAAQVYIDLDLHWSDCGNWVNEGGCLGQHNMPDQISVVFWHDVATRYKTHPYPNKKDWDKNFGEISQKHPVYVGEWGFGGQAFSHTNGPAYGQRLMGYLQGHDIRMWTAWNFSATAGPTMFKNWLYEPTVFGEFVEKQLAEAATVRGSAK
ncbi:MAG TPA: hypothetical protein VG077_05285 [Verrucomicrobiae bacterium]|nr:hypothetical protein [Verrucomicrobiae bacterium]